MKTQTPLELKRAARARRDKECAAALARAKLHKKQAVETRKQGLPLGALTRYFYLPQLVGCSIRKIDDFSSRSYALDRQVEDLIRHLYVRYPVPRYMLRSILTPEGVELLFREKPAPLVKNKMPEDWEYRRWLLAAGQGSSLAKVTKGVLTRKESHWAAQAPVATFQEAIVWAKAKALDVPSEGLDWTRTYLAGYAGTDMVDTVLQFFAKHWEAMTPGQRRDLLDFLTQLSGDVGRYLHGRGLKSVLEASEEWHRQAWQIKRYGDLKWEPRYRPWRYENIKGIYEATELCTIHALIAEGQAMRHCVGTYGPGCHSGSSAIFSLRFQWKRRSESRLTAEVFPNLQSVVQVKGPRNAKADNDEKKMVMLWAGEMGLAISDYAI
jgi:hypothetical protein